MLSEISQTEKNKYCLFSLICKIQKVKQMNIKKQNQIHRHKEHTSSYQMGKGWKEEKQEKGIKKHKLLDIKQKR